MTLLLLMFSAALATDLQPFAPPGEVIEPEIEVATPRALLDEAGRRILLGDYEGARILAEQALERPGEHQVEASYLLGMAWEYDGDPQRALVIYEGLPATDDLVFRRAAALGADHRYEEGLAELDQLADVERKPADLLKIAVLRGLYEIETDRKGEEQGLIRLRDALEGAAPGDSPWYQARARERLVSLGVAQAQTIAFKGGKKKKGKQVEERGALVAMAEEQVVQIIELQQPYWALRGLLSVGQAYEAFGDAMLAEGKVHGLKKRQVPIYEEERAKQVEQIWVKSAKRYDRGATYAEQIGWTGNEKAELEQAHAALVARIEAM